MARGQRQAVKDIDWLLSTTNHMVGCRSVAALLDLAYNAIREGLGYDRVGLLLVDAAHGTLVEHIGTDVMGRKFYPRDRVMPLGDGGYYARLLTDPRLQADGPGFIYMEDAAHEVPPEAQRGLDGRPGQSLRVALRSAQTVSGLIGVDNLSTGRPIRPEDAPPLVAFANALAAAVESVAALEERGRRITTLDADLRQRVEQLSWLQMASERLGRLHDLEDVLDNICTLVCSGLGYDRLGLFLLTAGPAGEWGETEVRGVDQQGMLWRSGESGPLKQISFRADDPGLAVHAPDVFHLLQGHSYYYCSDSWANTPPESRPLLDGEVHEQLVVALRQDGALLGYLSVDNLLSGRPITEIAAPPLVAFAAQAALAISRARLWAEHAAQGANLARRVAELEWLGAISGQVNAAHTLEEVLDVAYEGIRGGLGYDRVGIQLVDHAAGVWEERLGTDADGRKFQPTDRILALTPQSAIWSLPDIAALLQGAEFYYTADAVADTPPEQRYLLDGGPAEQLTVAIRSGESLVGTISVDNLVTRRPITARDARPLLALAHQVGTAIENARLHERERAERIRLQVAALTDYLTNLGNHRAFQEDFHREAARAQRHGEWLTLALIDMDGFKMVNDSQGHSQGDQVLMALGRVLRTSRAEDLAYRIGGDEFALILPATTEVAAGEVVERLRQEAEQLLGGVTLSIGVAGVLGNSRQDMERLHKEADVALYEAKHRGRNRVVLFSEIRGRTALTAPVTPGATHDRVSHPGGVIARGCAGPTPLE